MDRLVLTQTGAWNMRRDGGAMSFFHRGKSVARRTWNREFAKQISQECVALFFIIESPSPDGYRISKVPKGAFWMFCIQIKSYEQRFYA